MSSRLLKVYHRLPPKARSAVATLRGWYLLRSRYGKGSAALSAEARERDEWTPQQWKTWVEERVAYMLHRAATRVPYYRNLWQERRRRGDRAAWDVLAHWPLLEKNAVRMHPRDFLAEDCDPRRMFREHTSGTTGTPVLIWRSRESLEQLYAIADDPTCGWGKNSQGGGGARRGGAPVPPPANRSSSSRRSRRPAPAAGKTSPRAWGGRGWAGSSSRPCANAGRHSGSGMPRCGSSTCRPTISRPISFRSEEHTSELQSRLH